MQTKLNKIAKAMWSHRAVYAGLAGVYGAACLGLDKDLANQMLTGLYVAMVAQSDH